MTCKKRLFTGFCAISCMAFALSCSAGNDTSIVIPFINDGGERIYLDATINGYAGRFFLDTGTMLSWARINTEGLDAEDCVTCRCIVCGCTHCASSFRVDSIRFGDMDVRSRSLFVTEHEFFSVIETWTDGDGILGMLAFEGFWMELSFSRNEIVLHRQKLAHFANADHVPLVMLEERFSALYLPIDIDGREFLMNVDTGLPSALFFPNDIVNYTPPENMMGRILSGGEIGDFYLVRANSITVLDRTYNDRLIMNNSYLAARRNWESHTDKGLIGVRFLRNYDLLIDNREIFYGRTTGLYFIPIVPPEERDYGITLRTEVPVSGITNFRFSENGLAVTGIIMGSLAYNLGLRLGTEITSIRGRTIDTFTLEELRDPMLFGGAAPITILNEHGDEVGLRLSE